MKATTKRSWGTAVVALVLATCGGQIVRSAVAAPVTQPTAKDARKADRTAVSRTGGEDTKGSPPPAEGYVGGNGIVEPRERETRVAAQVTAVVKKVFVQEGQRVHRGDPLVELSDEVEAAALQSAEAELAGERAKLSRTLRGLRLEDKDAVAAEADAAKARAELSAGVLARTEKLAQSGGVTEEELDRARRQAQTDAASYRATDARFRAAESGSRREDIAASRATLLGAEARVAQARALLERLTIRAPADGEVLQVKLREGELYSFQGSEPLVVMGDTSGLRVRMDVDERDIGRVRVGASAYVTADAFGARRFSGKVVEIGRRFGRKNLRTDDPVERNDTKVLETVIELEANSLLVPGQRVTSFVEAAAASG